MVVWLETAKATIARSASSEGFRESLSLLQPRPGSSQTIFFAVRLSVAHALVDPLLPSAKQDSCSASKCPHSYTANGSCTLRLTRGEKSLSKRGPVFPGSGHNCGESSSSSSCRHPWGVGVSARTSQSLSDNQRRKRRAKMKRAPPLAHPRSETEGSCSTTAHGRHRRRRRISEGENRGSLNGWVAAVSNATTQEDLHYHEEASSHPRLQRGEEMDESVSRDGERRADTVPPTPQGISAGQQTRLTRRRRRGNRRRRRRRRNDGWQERRLCFECLDHAVSK